MKETKLQIHLATDTPSYRYTYYGHGFAPRLNCEQGQAFSEGFG